MHYQHNDEGKDYDYYCRSSLQCGVWRKGYSGGTDRMLSTETTTVSQKLHFFSMHNPTAATRRPTKPNRGRQDC
jgi:hypothetical protein